MATAGKPNYKGLQTQYEKYFTGVYLPGDRDPRTRPRGGAVTSHVMRKHLNPLQDDHKAKNQSFTTTGVHMEAITKGIEDRKKDLDEGSEQWLEQARQHIEGLRMQDEQAKEDPASASMSESDSESDPPRSAHPRGTKRRRGDRDHNDDEADLGHSTASSRVLRATRQTTRSQVAQAGQADSAQPPRRLLEKASGKREKGHETSRREHDGRRGARAFG